MPNNGNSSYGGAQGRASDNTRNRHGLPRVPSDVTKAHELRRYLQSQRDTLNEQRWLNEGLSGLTANQQDRLVAFLVQVSQLQNIANNQATTITQQATLITQLQTDLTNLQNQHDQDEIANQQTHTQLQNDYAALLARVNCIDANTGGLCP